MDKKKLGERIKKLREAKGLSRKALAYRAGYKSEASIIAIEHGNLKPSYEKNKLIANALDISIKELFSENVLYVDHVAAKLRLLTEESLKELEHKIDELVELQKSISEIYIGSYKGENIISTAYKIRMNGSIKRINHKTTEGKSVNTAILKAITEIFKAVNLTGKVNIYTNSEYIVNIINSWGKIWSENGWKKKDGTEVLNSEILKTLVPELLKHQAKGILLDNGAQELKGLKSIAKDQIAK